MRTPRRHQMHLAPRWLRDYKRLGEVLEVRRRLVPIGRALAIKLAKAGRGQALRAVARHMLATADNGDLSPPCGSPGGLLLCRRAATRRGRGDRVTAIPRDCPWRVLLGCVRFDQKLLRVGRSPHRSAGHCPPSRSWFLAFFAKRNALKANFKRAQHSVRTFDLQLVTSQVKSLSVVYVVT